jgi:hypothetical protein
MDTEIAKNTSYLFLEFLFLDENEFKNRFKEK